MVTASHLPADRNGFKFFTKEGGGFTKEGISTLISEAVECASVVYYETGHENMGSGSFQNVRVSNAALFLLLHLSWLSK
jgi:phosphomannomutase